MMLTREDVMGMTLEEFAAMIEAAVACDPNLVLLSATIRLAHARGTNAESFSKLVSLALQSAYLQGIRTGTGIR